MAAQNSFLFSKYNLQSYIFEINQKLEREILNFHDDFGTINSFCQQSELSFKFINMANTHTGHFNISIGRA